MRIDFLHIFGFKRFSLNQISEFKFTPTEIVNLFLGSNGSGKSSLISQLTPLPSDPNDYIKNGFKTIHLTNNGNDYNLHSTFNPTRFSFIKNGEELNIGGTVTVFRELVSKEFNLTNDIHELLIDKDLFTEMSPAKKREWFTKLSDTNYDYALSVYSKLKERSRDIVGALKLAKSRLVTESAKVISKEEENKLKHDVELTHKELNLLIEQSAPLDRPVSEYRDEKENKLLELSKVSMKLLGMRCIAPYGTYPYGLNPKAQVELNDWGESLKMGFNDISEIEIVIDEISHKVTGIEVLINNSMIEHDKLSENIKILIRSGEDDIFTLHEKGRVLSNRIKELLGVCKLKFDIPDPNSAMNALNSIHDTLINISINIPENSDKRFNSARLNELNDIILDTKNMKLKLISDLSKTEGQVKHLEAHKDSGNIACPKCNHNWIPGYSDEHLQLLIDKMDRYNRDIIGITDTIEKMELEITNIQEYSKLYKEFTNCVNNWPILNLLWDKLITENYLINKPRMIGTLLDTFKNDLEYTIEAKKLQIELSELLDLIKSTEMIGDSNLAEMQSKLNEYVLSIESMTNEVSQLKNDLNLYRNYKKELNEAFELSDKCKELINHVESANKSMIEMIRRETLNHCVRQLQSALAMKETTLNGLLIQNSIIADLDSQVKKLTIEDEAVKLLLDNLSPVNGIIADGLVNFIKVFLRDMNKVIKEIWTYPLEVLECKFEDDGLSYKFPILVDTEIKSEVKLGSRSMVDMFNLAFKITSMKYLHIENHPLIIDEFTSGYDLQHRSTAMRAINEIINNRSFSQLFMVSHDFSSYGIFNKADIVVLDAKNITVPKEYNLNVIIN